MTKLAPADTTDLSQGKEAQPYRKIGKIIDEIIDTVIHLKEKDERAMRVIRPKAGAQLSTVGPRMQLSPSLPRGMSTVWQRAEPVSEETPQPTCYCQMSDAAMLVGLSDGSVQLVHAGLLPDLAGFDPVEAEFVGVGLQIAKDAPVALPNDAGPVHALVQLRTWEGGPLLALAVCGTSAVVLRITERVVGSPRRGEKPGSAGQGAGAGGGGRVRFGTPEEETVRMELVVLEGSVCTMEQPLESPVWASACPLRSRYPGDPTGAALCGRDGRVTVLRVVPMYQDGNPTSSAGGRGSPTRMENPAGGREVPPVRVAVSVAATWTIAVAEGMGRVDWMCPPVHPPVVLAWERHGNDVVLFDAPLEVPQAPPTPDADKKGGEKKGEKDRDKEKDAKGKAKGEKAQPAEGEAEEGDAVADPVPRNWVWHTSCPLSHVHVDLSRGGMWLCGDDGTVDHMSLAMLGRDASIGPVIDAVVSVATVPGMGILFADKTGNMYSVDVNWNGLSKVAKVSMGFKVGAVYGAGDLGAWIFSADGEQIVLLSQDKRVAARLLCPRADRRFAPREPPVLMAGPGRGGPGADHSLTCCVRDELDNKLLFAYIFTV
ncbi:unnamed protein product [Pedinophyceae sp. YPF-701]|nr:unnamed protein product [Pedinophyceae sp. YPF-701]